MQYLEREMSFQESRPRGTSELRVASNKKLRRECRVQDLKAQEGQSQWWTEGDPASDAVIEARSLGLLQDNL